jgi:hypothetical protein
LCGRVTSEQQHEHRGQGQRRKQGGQQSARPANVELLERHRSGALDFLQEQTADQEPREYEEDVNAQESTGHRRDPGVVQQDRQHRNGADAVQTGDVAHLGRGRTRVRSVPRDHIDGHTTSTSDLQILHRTFDP